MAKWLPAIFALSVAGLFTIATAVSADAATSTLYVGGAGCSDSGAGTATQPFCTIIKAGTVATAGQTVLVASGTYQGTVSVTHSGAAGAPIVLQPSPGATVTVSGGPYGFSISGRSYVTVSGFSISGTVHNGILVSSSDHVIISGNTVTTSGQPVSGQIAAGITVSGSTNSLITFNRSDNNSDSGIYLKSGTTSTTVSYNEASGNANGYQRNANGINVISPGNTIIGNVLHDNEDSGLQFYPGGNSNLATLNVSYNNGDHGIDDYNVTGGRLIGNTIYHNCTSGINVEGTSGNYLVENNIAADNAVYPAYKGIACNRRAGNIGIWDSAPASTTVNSNLVYLSKAGTMYVFGTAYASLSAMQAATHQEPNGLQGNPQFIDAANANLQLAGNSPAIDSADSGASGEQAADVLGVARVDVAGVPNTGIGPRGYDDRGAYEFNGTVTPPANNPPVAQLAVTPISGVAPLQVSADGSGSSDPDGQALTYRYDFGDGSVLGPQSAATATHTYTAAGSYRLALTVTDPGGLTSTTATTVTVSPPPTSTVGYVSQIATNYSTSRHTAGSITVWRSGGVAAGHLMVLTVNLTGTTAGPVSATDSAGDRFTVASDISDAAGHRLVVLSGVTTAGLAPNQSITASFPSAATYRVTGDDVQGATVADVQAAAGGAGTAFSSGATATTSAASEFVFTAVGAYGSGAPAWSSGWRALSNYPVNTDYLGRAYRISTSPGSFAGSGTVSGTGWLATTVTFR